MFAYAGGCVRRGDGRNAATVSGAFAAPRTSVTSYAFRSLTLQIRSHADRMDPQAVRHCPALHNLRPAANQDQLPMVLERAGQRCALLFHDFLQVSADEEVISASNLRAPDLTMPTPLQYPTKVRKFRYIVIPRPSGDLPGFEEYRTDLKGNPPDATSLGGLFMITSDFVSLGLHLSAGDQPGSNFRYFGIQAIRNRECHVVGFAQDPTKARHVEELDIEGRRVILLVQGLAWIDSQTFQILRIMTWLLAPRTDIGLNSQVSTVDYYPVPAERIGESALATPRCRGSGPFSRH